MAEKFYWVNWGGEWTAALFNYEMAGVKHYSLPGREEEFTERDFDEIGPEIEPPTGPITGQ